MGAASADEAEEEEEEEVDASSSSSSGSWPCCCCELTIGVGSRCLEVIDSAASKRGQYPVVLLPAPRSAIAVVGAASGLKGS